MIDTNTAVSGFHDDEVRLPERTQKELRGHRAANQERLKSGLAAAKRSKVDRFVKQGSYAMHTINQHPNNDYDIDDGAAFKKEDLVGPRGAPLTTLATRQMVRDAVDDGSFTTAPAVRDNCVRVAYALGHHVDIPVYCIVDAGTVNERLELASAGGWRNSDPTGVTDWFNANVTQKSPDKENGRQMRRVVRLLKYFAKSRDSWNSPSGFILSVLVNECYFAVDGRDDEAFLKTARSISSRLGLFLTVQHPVLSENLTKSANDACMIDFRDNLKSKLEYLEVLEDRDCTHKAAMTAWNKFFNTKYFGKKVPEPTKKSSGGGAGGIGIAKGYSDRRGPSNPGRGRFG